APPTRPIIGGEMASPSRWMTRMLIANPGARNSGWVTLAMMVLVGPVLKNRKKTNIASGSHARGKGSHTTARRDGNASTIAAPETRKYDPDHRGLSTSPAHPPTSVATSPVSALSAPNKVATGTPTPRPPRPQI